MVGVPISILQLISLNHWNHVNPVHSSSFRGLVET
jgi:hypothetical protein